MYRGLSEASYFKKIIKRDSGHAVCATDKRNYSIELASLFLQKCLFVRSKSESPRTASAGAVLEQNRQLFVKEKKWGFVTYTGNRACTGEPM